MAERKPVTKARRAKQADSAELGSQPNETTVQAVCFEARLYRPVAGKEPVDWLFLSLPDEASRRLSSRGLVAVEGTFQGVGFGATLEPDGQGGHWMKVEKALQQAADVAAGELVTLEIKPAAVEPEPVVPDDLRDALTKGGPAVALEVWADITPVARRDWIHWITSAKREETRAKRVATACDMLAKGKRRPCCFDRSGIYSKGLSKPLADES